MARLFIFRHGKTEYTSPSGHDRDRRLVSRGVRNSIQMAELMQQHMPLPEVILVSPAVRTSQTADEVMGVFGPGPEVIQDDRLYLADGDTLFEVITTRAADARVAMVIGHNPGLFVLAHLLMAEDGNRASKSVSDFPTAALADLVFEPETFRDLEYDTGQMLSLLRPRELGFNT
ncbi:histidine phosphatase family protein [Alphaproteobacteria bacterium LSUCC0684]